MFTKTKAFSSFSVKDISTAKSFYSVILGLEAVEENGLLFLNIKGNNRIVIYPKPNHVAATFTVLNFPVENIDSAVDELIALGIVFEQYEGEQIKTDGKGICRSEHGPQIAWFKDPAGNILSVLEEGKPPAPKGE